MTEDILEQLIDNYFLRKPSTFTKHNIKYRPNLNRIPKKLINKYSVHSDIDVITINAKTKETNVITCKSWQGGFDIKKYYTLLSNKEMHKTKPSGREVWKSFRELTDKTWAKAFRDKIFEETTSKRFNYIIAVTKIRNNKFHDEFCSCKSFLDNLSNKGEFKVTISFLTLEQIITSIQDEDQKTAIESTEIGRFLQLLNAANLKLERKVNR